MVAMGQIPDGTLGFEANGIVARVEQHATSFSRGNRVCTFALGAHRIFLRSKADFRRNIPGGFSFERAATVPQLYSTAFYSLVHIVRFPPKQSILIHTAAGGVGRTAFQITKHHQLEMFATVGSSDKRRLIRNLYGIPDDNIFNSRNLSLA